ncbi:Hypothetical protein D9617_1g087360 [Elsinoe fawcettii]|nr:Hypothetical protein D9617_1g087360 [Elsinoe fawcettii]
MPVTLRINNHLPTRVTEHRALTTEKLFQGACPNEYKSCKTLFKSSLDQKFLEGNHVASSANGFVLSAYLAYSKHHDLTIRPEDVWFAILSQLSFHINAHAEELRHFFVAHDGQEQVEYRGGGNINTVGWGRITQHFTKEMDKYICDPELRTWVMPDFTTTTESDRAVAAVLMMGSLKSYFKCYAELSCGLPSVTLLGERSDWETMLEKVEKLAVLGPEPTRFMTFLQPILRRFVATFDSQPSPDILDFWHRIADRTGGSGPRFLSGWITAFCFWNEKGELLEGKTPISPRRQRQLKDCELDGITYYAVKLNDVPSGFASAPVTVNDNGKMYKTKMLAGSVGMVVSCSGELTTEIERREQRYVMSGTPEGLAPDSVQPLSAWFMYEVKEIEACEPEPPAVKIDYVGQLQIFERQIELERKLNESNPMATNSYALEVAEQQLMIAKARLLAKTELPSLADGGSAADVNFDLFLAAHAQKHDVEEQSIAECSDDVPRKRQKKRTKWYKSLTDKLSL